MEGPAFCALDPQEHIEVVPRLQVLAWSSPEVNEDKRVLIGTPSLSQRDFQRHG